MQKPAPSWASSLVPGAWSLGAYVSSVDCCPLAYVWCIALTVVMCLESGMEHPSIVSFICSRFGVMYTTSLASASALTFTSLA
jgi:hypothetical protein